MKKNAAFITILVGILFAGCSVSKQVKREAIDAVLGDEEFSRAHIGISIYEPATKKYWYNHQADKYFVPASNTKLLTCYAAMKYLSDSLAGLRYYYAGDTLYVFPTGDPTLLHPEFSQQPVLSFLSQESKQIVINTAVWQEQRWGSGWSWDDYSDYYAAERNAMPVFGNVLRIGNRLGRPDITPRFFTRGIEVDNRLDTSLFAATVRRDFSANHFKIIATDSTPYTTETPFVTGDELLRELLTDTLGRALSVTAKEDLRKNKVLHTIYSQPTDSMLKPLMHRSDNFFAEQTLLMVSEQLLGIMNDERVIDTLLKTDFAGLPQKPNWVDGSGLSHYNLFSPLDFVMILEKMKNDLGMERVKTILPTGGRGTIRNYYQADSGFIYAKTGTLTGVVALSGFLTTKKNRQLIFSILVNNHTSSATAIRKGVEKFLSGIRRRY